jgi:O-antigen/teichoic acid export membrane protein
VPARVPATPPPISQGIPLKRRVLTASAWSLGGYGVSLVIRFGSNLVMTRLLAPEMFGVMAIATIVMVGLAMFSDLGVRQSIVQSRRGSDPAFLNTAWVLQIARGLLLWLLALLISLMIYCARGAGMVPESSVYANPSLPWVIAALSFSAAMNGLESTKLHEANRNLAFGQITQIDIATQIAGSACMFTWAYFDRSIWALVFGAIVTALVRTLLTHTSLPGNANQLQWDNSTLRELVNFGKWIFLSSILGFLVNSGDRLLLGWMVDHTVLGVYMIAFLIFSSIEQVLIRIIASVAFPAFSEVARHRRNLKAAYYRFHAVIAAIAYFSAGILITSGDALINLLYDHRYAQAGWILQILAVGLLTIPFQIAIQGYMAIGVPAAASAVTLARLLALLVLTPIGFYVLDLSGAIWGIVFSQLTYMPSILFFNRKFGLLDLRREFLPLPAIFLGIALAKIVLIGIEYVR